MTNSLMTLDEYQNLASKTAIYNGRESYLGLMYVTGKLCGESGEVSELVFKAGRDESDLVVFHKGNNFHTVYMREMSEERKQKIRKELGDVLWYVAQIAFEIGDTLSEVAAANITKLATRKDLGLLQGSGSDREQQ